MHFNLNVDSVSNFNFLFFQKQYPLRRTSGRIISDFEHSPLKQPSIVLEKLSPTMMEKLTQQVSERSEKWDTFWIFS